LFAAAAATIAAWVLLPPPKYTAYAQLRVASRPAQVAFTIAENRTETKDELDKYQQTQLEMVKGRLVLNAALRQPQVAGLGMLQGLEDPLDWLGKELEVNYVNGSDILRIALKGQDPRESAIIVNAVMDAYLREVVAVEESRRLKRLEQLQEIYNTYQANLSSSRRVLRELAEQAGATDPTTLEYKQRLELERHSMAEKELMQYRSELRKARAELKAARARQGAELEAAQVSAKVSQILAGDEYLRQYRLDVDRASQRYESVRRTVSYLNDPALRARAVELKNATDRLTSWRRAAEERAIAQLRDEADASLNTKLVLLEERIAILEEMDRKAQEDVDRLTAASRSSNKQTLDLQSRKDELAWAENAARKIGEDMEALKVELKAEQRIKELDRADVPRVKEGKRPLMAGMSGLAALSCVLLGFSWWEFQTRKVSSVDDVVSALRLPIVGILPAVPAQVLRRAAAANGNAAADLSRVNELRESIDAARTMLVYASRERQASVIMVASALSGEGKTTLACHLAGSLAWSGQRTLLVDGDLRNPRLHRLFDLPSGPGFCDLLRGESSKEDPIRETPVSDLFLCTAGRVDDLAFRLLAQGRPRRVFEYLKDEFEYIIVDSAPVLPVSDALLLGQHVDAVVFSVRNDVSRLPAVCTAYEMVARLGIQTLGIVLTGDKGRTYGQEYPYCERNDNHYRSTRL
jgi:capsular exopolysaccharide synthesis family protein